MTLSAFKNGITPFAENVMNPLLSLQPFKLIYEGATFDSKAGSGTTANNSQDYHYAIRFTTTGVTGITRLELELEAGGFGQDVTIDILDTDFATDGSAEGTILKTITIPKEFLPATAATVYAAINLTGLTIATDYWVKVHKTGDATDNFVLVGESSADASHPVYYRAGTSGAWTSGNAIHFTAYDGANGDVIHEIYADNGVATYTYDGEDLDKIYLYLPPSDGADGGIRDILELSFDGEYLDEGVIL